MVCPYNLLVIDMDGLNDKEVVKSRKKYGTNQIIMGKKDGFLRLFLESLGDPIIKILFIALSIKVIFLFRSSSWYETIGIVIAIIIASLISTISEYGSSLAFEKLMEESSKIHCKVYRNGKLQEIFIDDIVVGDILFLESGDKIGADGCVIRGSVSVDESSFNGEAMSIKKNVKDIVYRGCVVYEGNAYVRVDKVGNNTYYGRMIEELGVDSGISPLKNRLNSLAMILSKIGYFCAFLVSGSYLFNKIVISNGFQISRIFALFGNFSLLFAYLLHALTLAVTVIVVSVPEGLPMMVTLVLSSNMKKMLHDHVLVRKMVGIETAGSLNILFTDKTGTLTNGNLEVSGFMLGDGSKYFSIGGVSKKYQQYFVDSLIYNNASYYDYDSDEIVGGNVTDKAILNYIKVKRRKSVSVIKEKLFDSKDKYSMVLLEEDGKKIKYVKGAYEVILSHCDRYLDQNGMKRLILHPDLLQNEIDKVTSNGIRVICVAYSEDTSFSLGSLILIGFLLIKDDVRKESRDAVKKIQDAGVQVVMVTGDYKETAISIAREVGIVKSKEDIVLTGEEFHGMGDDELKNIFPKLRVLSRALPDDKSRLVQIARELNLVVGMTGDGVNDAIALRRADVGFSMGSGTEVSKEASDIIIMDNNILSIEKAILYGRTIFKSIRKFIIFQLTVNMCAVGVSVIGPFVGVQTPVTVIQMLWINMVMDTLAGLAFSYERPLIEYMDEPPKKRNENIINSYMFQEILITGFYSVFLCIFFLKSSFIHQFFRVSVSNQYLMTAFFGLFIFISIFNSFNARTIRLNILKDIFNNKVFLLVILFVVMVQIGMIYYGGSLFRTSGLTLREFVVMFLTAFTVIPFDMIRKYITKKIKGNMEI